MADFPTLYAGPSPAILEDEIEQLRKELLQFKQDPLWKMFFALTKKNNELADDLNSFTLNITEENKTFDRFLKLLDKIEPFQSTLARLRQDYLKIGDEDVEKEEKKGVPLIEQLGKRRNTKGKQ